MVELQYLASRTKNLDRSFFPNTPAPGAGAIDPRRPNQLFRNIRVIQNDLVGNYDSLAVIFRRRMTNGLALNAHYTWSQTKDMAEHSNGGGRDPRRVRHLARLRPGELGRSAPARDQRHLRAAVLPQSDNVFLREVLGGWQVSGVATFQSGTPLNVTISGDRANNGSPNQRPNVLRDVELNCQDNPSGIGPRQLHRLDGLRACRTCTPTATRRATCFVAWATAGPTSR